MSTKRDIFKKAFLPFILVLLLAGHIFLVNVGWKNVERENPYRVVPKLNIYHDLFLYDEAQRSEQNL